MRGDPGLNYYWDSIYLATPSHLKTAASPPISSRTIQWVVRSWGMWQSGDMAVSQMKETLTLELKKPRKYRQFVSLQGNLSYIFCLIYLDSWLALTKVHEDMHGASNTARRQFSHEYRILRAWPLDHRGTTSTYTSIEQTQSFVKYNALPTLRKVTPFTTILNNPKIRWNGPFRSLTRQRRLSKLGIKSPKWFTGLLI